MLPLRITSLAHRDIADAALWFESQQLGLGERFFAEVDATIATVCERPGSFPEVYRTLRRAQVKYFQYGVFFHGFEHEIVIVGVVGLRHDPRVYQSRALD